METGLYKDGKLASFSGQIYKILSQDAKNDNYGDKEYNLHLSNEA